jgi:hypothetical protein
MAKFTLQNVRLFVSGADLTTVNNKVELNAEVEDQESTAFVPSGPAWTEVLAGLRSTEANGEGQWEAGDPTKVDDVAFSTLGALVPWTACPAGANVGDLGWLTAMRRTSYSLGDAVGEVAPWSIEGKGNWPLVRGLIAHPPGTARTTTGTGTITQLGAVAAGQNLYASLHVLSVAGTTPAITVTIQSATAVGFASPTTRLTFTSANAVGGEVLRVAGPITDQYYRASWSITGTTPSFLFVSSFGIA